MTSRFWTGGSTSKETRGSNVRSCESLATVAARWPPVSDSNGPMTAWSRPTRSSVCPIYMKAGWRRKHRNSWRRFPEREGGSRERRRRIAARFATCGARAGSESNPDRGAREHYYHRQFGGRVLLLREESGTADAPEAQRKRIQRLALDEFKRLSGKASAKADHVTVFPRAFQHRAKNVAPKSPRANRIVTCKGAHIPQEPSTRLRGVLLRNLIAILPGETGSPRNSKDCVALMRIDGPAGIDTSLAGREKDSENFASSGLTCELSQISDSKGSETSACTRMWRVRVSKAPK